jgi:ABC-type Na+ efflux pump permease subunit
VIVVNSVLNERKKAIIKLKNWFRDLGTVLKKDLISTKRVKKYFFSAVIPPLVMLIVFTSFLQTSNPETYTVIVVDNDDSQLSKKMVDYVANISSDFAPWFTVVKIDTYDEAMKLLQDFTYLGLIYIPSGFEANITSGVPNQKGILYLIVQNINNDYVKNYMQRLDEAILIFNEQEHESPGSVDLFAINLEKNYIIDQPVNNGKIITLGIIAMYGIICGMVFGALNIAKEYEDFTILEIANSPVRRTAYMASKQLIAILLGGLVILVISILLFLIFQIEFRGNLIIVIFSFMLSAWIHSGIGCLIGLKFKRTMPVILICIVSSMLLWFFTGGFAPLIILGQTVITLSRFFPATYWTEILFAETLFPSWTYVFPRLLILIILSVITTFITWYIISKEGFRS